ncbi:MAG: magnesium transporter [Thermoplasmata archaeon]|jgi:magnesium transporter|nr:magnesium transporter [Thermoplasmata archaeon]MEA3165824.1 magnesium transporter [Thermoplasmata archaeon]
MRVLAFEGGAWRQSGDLRPEEARDLAWGPTHVWIRLEGLAQSKLDALAAVFDLHPLTLEDVRNHRQRPKVEDYPNLTFVVARAPRWNQGTDEMSWLTVGIFLGPDFLITVCTDPVAELDAVEKRLLGTKVTPKTATIDHAFYQVLDTIVDSYFPIMDDLEERIEELEEGIVESPEAHELAKVMELKHIVSQTRKTVYPMREATVELEKGEHPNIRDETCIYLRDVADHMTRLAERLEHVNQIAVLTQESYNAAVQQQTNRIVKVLAGITFVITVPMLVGTFYGMNLTGVPQWDPVGVGPWWTISGILAITTVPLYLLSKKLDWL